MLEAYVRVAHTPSRWAGVSVLLGIGDGSTDGVLGSLASFR